MGNGIKLFLLGGGLATHYFLIIDIEVLDIIIKTSSMKIKAGNTGFHKRDGEKSLH